MEIGALGGNEKSIAALAGTVVFAACLSVIYTTPGDAYWIVDCGNKALLAQRLLETGYGDASFDYPAVRFDPERRWFPIPAPFAVPRGEGFVSSYPPAYAALAAPALGLLGPRGLRLPAALGAALSAAFFAAWAASAVGRRWALGGALVLGVASPLFFYGVTVWEHSLTVALTLAAWLSISRDGAGRWAAAGALVGAACWIREETALMAAAIVIASALTRRPYALWLAFVAGVAVPLAVLLLFNSGHYGSAFGAHLTANLGADARESVFSGSSPSGRLVPIAGLLGGLGRQPGERWIFGLLAVSLPILGWLAARRGPRVSWLPLSLAAGSAAAWGVASSRIAFSARPLEALVLHNGLLLQWPMVGLVGLGLDRVWRGSDYAQVRTAALAGAIFVILVVAVGAAVPSSFGAQVGAGVHWGPRVLLPGLPALVLLALAALRRCGGGLGRSEWIAWSALVTAGVLSTVLATWLLSEQKLEAERFTRKLRSLEPDVVVTVHPLMAQHLAPLWREKPSLLTVNAPSLVSATAALRRRGVREFLFIVPPAAAAPTWLPGVACRRVTQHRGRRLHYFDLDVQRCRVEPVH